MEQRLSMQPKVYTAIDLVSSLVKYQFDNKNPFPFRVNDLVLWDEHESLALERFNNWMGIYFEYVEWAAGCYRITGILTKNL